ncbi:MAG: CsbD family protein [Syntrophaceae bacterium]
MDKDILLGKWKQLKVEFKKQWGNLTDDDLDKAEGDRDKLLGVLQEKYGYSKDQAREHLDRFLNEHRT